LMKNRISYALLVPSKLFRQKPKSRLTRNRRQSLASRAQASKN